MKRWGSRDCRDGFKLLFVGLSKPVILSGAKRSRRIPCPVLQLCKVVFEILRLHRVAAPLRMTAKKLTDKPKFETQICSKPSPPSDSAHKGQLPQESCPLTPTDLSSGKNERDHPRHYTADVALFQSEASSVHDVSYDHQSKDQPGKYRKNR